MPRAARDSLGGYCYHVLNRGNRRACVFHKQGDYQAFVRLLAEALQRIESRLLAFCLMPNHFHLTLWPRQDGELSQFMMWLSTAHVRRYHQHYHSSGHVWQGRFRAFPIQEDEHLLCVQRYIERNPVRAGLVERAQDWRWSRASECREGLPPLTASPVAHQVDWLRYVKEPQSEAEVEALRECVRRRRPYGSAQWTAQVARTMGLQASLHPLGRPRKPMAQPAALDTEADADA